MVKRSDIRSDDPNSYRRRTRSGATGCRRSARLSHHYGVTGWPLSKKLITAVRRRSASKTKNRIRREEITTDGTSKTEEEVNEYRQRRGITVQDRDVPNPIRTFSDTGFPDNVIQEISKAGFVRPTPIQAQVWPIALKGRDLIGIAEPGSGKTLAYLMPAIAHVKSQPELSEGDGPIVLVLATTTKLAAQIKRAYTKFGAASDITALCGHPYAKKESRLESGVGILIATDLDLLTMLELDLTNLQRVTYFVLDDADWMLNKVTEPKIRQIVSKLRPDCQKLFLGATWPEEVDNLARPFLRNACKVEIGSPVLKATQSVDQIVDIVNDDQKYSKLVRLLGDIVNRSGILIFMGVKKGCKSCDQIAAQLCKEGWRAVSVHENKSRAEMDLVVSEFQAGKIPIMIATDAAIRDLGVKGVKYVINYNFPGSIDEYVYRIDHSVSSGAKGTAYTFFTAANARFAKELTILLKEAGQKVSPELAALGHGVPHAGSTYISPPRRFVPNNKSRMIGIGHFFPVYVHSPEIKNVAMSVIKDVYKKKGLQLHLVRVVEAFELLSATPVDKTYLTFEAADANTCVTNAYRAIVMEWVVDRPGRLKTVLFGRVNLDGNLSPLFDNTGDLDFNVYKLWRESR